MNLFWIITLLGISSAAILLPDLFRNPDTVKNILGIPSGFIAAICILVGLILRLIAKKGKSKASIRVVLLFICCVFFVLSTIFSFLNYSIHPNFVYSLFLINTHICLYLALASGAAWLLMQSNKFFKTRYSSLLVALPLIVLISGLMMLIWPLNTMSRITSEDGIVEFLQVIILIAGSVGALVTSKNVFRKNSKISIFFAALSLILLLIAGDEISWGQRFFGFSTPLAVQSINSQKETTIHNLSLIDGLVPLGYLAIGIYGSVISIIIRSVKMLSENVRYYFVPSNKYFVVFILPAFYNGYTTFFDHSIGNLSEPAELLLYAAISLFVIELSVKKKRG